jgi:superkiller protein 3
MILAQNAEMDPDAAKFYNAGNKLLKSGNYQGAISEYDNALKTSNDYRIYYQKGVSLKKLQQYDNAIASFKSALENNPKFDLAYNGLGGIYFAQKQYGPAAEAFKKFEELTAKDKLKNKAKEYISKSYTKLGEQAKMNGNYQKAVEHLTHAVNNHKYDAAFLLLAETYVDLGDYNNALVAADNALNNRKTITRGGPLYYKGMAFKGLEDKEKAKEAFTAGKSDSKYRSLCEYELKLLN